MLEKDGLDPEDLDKYEDELDTESDAEEDDEEFVESPYMDPGLYFLLSTKTFSP